MHVLEVCTAALFCLGTLLREVWHMIVHAVQLVAVFWIRSCVDALLVAATGGVIRPCRFHSCTLLPFSAFVVFRLVREYLVYI